MNARRPLAILALALLLAGTAVGAERADPDRDRLAAALAQLDADPALADLAGLERLRARQALLRLQGAKSRQRDLALFLAERWVEAAVDAANAELLGQQSQQLDRERDQIMIEASRRAAERARREADTLRLQTLVREEEAQRQAETDRLAREQTEAQAQAASAEAEQANRLAAARAREVELARKEAELAAAMASGADADGGTKPAPGGGATRAAPPPSRKAAGRTVYTLDGDAFPVGSAQLTAGALASVKALAAQVAPGHDVHIDAYTDSQGEAGANQVLSQRRADAVRRALAAGGVSPQAMDATGRGEAKPVGDNQTAAGRAKNRRVEITVE